MWRVELDIVAFVAGAAGSIVSSLLNNPRFRRGVIGEHLHDIDRGDVTSIMFAGCLGYVITYSSFRNYGDQVRTDLLHTVGTKVYDFHRLGCFDQYGEGTFVRRGRLPGLCNGKMGRVLSNFSVS